MNVSDLAATVMIGSACVALVTYLVITRSKALEAIDIAQEAKTIAKENQEKIEIAKSAFGVYREESASKYMDKDDFRLDLRDMEARIMNAISSLQARIDKQEGKS